MSPWLKYAIWETDALILFLKPRIYCKIDKFWLSLKQTSLYLVIACIIVVDEQLISGSAEFCSKTKITFDLVIHTVHKTPLSNALAWTWQKS